MEAGLKTTFSPLPCPVAEKAMAELKPPVIVVVALALPIEFLGTVSAWGFTPMAKSGFVEPPVSVLIRVGPLGLPQPVTRSYRAVAENPLLPLVMSWKLAR